MDVKRIRTSDQVELALYEWGEGPVDFVFQHGLCGEAEQPREVAPEFDQIKFFALECRGHGRSEAGDHKMFSIPQFANDVIAFIETRSNPVVLGGISMGAAIAMRIAIVRPDLVKALILARPAWTSQSAPDNLRPNAYVGHLLSTMLPENAYKTFMQSEIATILRREAPDNLRSLESFFSRRPQDVTAALLTQIAGDGPRVSPDDIRKISVPTLVIGHEDDYIHPLAYAHELSKEIPGAQLSLITPKARNGSAYRHDFKTALLRFLEKVIHATS